MPTKDPFANAPGYKILIDRLWQLGHQQESFNNLLRVLGARHTIDKLYPVLDTFLKIAETFRGTLDNDPKWQSVNDRIIHASETADIILSNKSFINLPRLDLAPTQERNGVYKRMISRGPLFATLGYLPDDRSDLERHYVLLGQILIVHLLTIQKNLGNKMDKAFSDALLGVRTLTKSKHLSDYPTDPSIPEAYIPHLERLESHDQLSNFLSFFLPALEATRPVSLRDLEKLINKPPVGNKEVFHFASPSPEHQLPKIVEETIPQSAHADDTNPPTTGLIFGFPDNLGSIPDEDFQRNTNMVVKARSLENQLFHFSWGNLNQFELKVLSDFLFKHVDDIETSPATKAQLGLMLFAGLEPKSLADLKLLTEDDGNLNCDTYITAAHTLRLRTPGPEYKTHLPPHVLAQAHPKQHHIDLCPPGRLTGLIKHHIDTQGTSSENQRLFSESESEISHHCSQAISSLKKKHGVRLTLHRIQNHIWRKLALWKGSDLSGASLTFGKEIYLARTRIHYAGPDSDTLQRIHTQAFNDLLKQAGHESNHHETYPDEITACVGTPIRPKLEVIQSLISALQSYLNQQRDKLETDQDTINFHNAYVLYTTLCIAYCTGYRASNSPFITDEMYDEVSGLCVIGDKTSKDQYHSRLVWLTEECRNQLNLFKAHRANIIQLAQEKIPKLSGLDSEFFFLSPEGQRQTVTRTKIIEHLKIFGFHLPPNVQRHFLKSELQEGGCPAEIIEIFLGHWHHGEEGWTSTSALNPGDYKATLEKHLVPLMRRIGITPLTGLTKIPKGTTLPLHVMTRQERAGKRKRNRKTTPPDQLLRDHPVHHCWVKAQGNVFVEMASQGVFRFKKHELFVLKNLHAILPELYNGEMNITVDQERLESLAKKLKPRPVKARTWYKRMNYLIKGLRLGQEHLGWTVDLPPKPTVTLKGYNLARPSLIRRLKIFREIEAIFLADLEETTSQNPAVLLGQILLSAILYGHINHQRWADGFIKGFPKFLYQHNHLLWVDLWTTSVDDLVPSARWLLQRNPQIYRRWFADPTTQTLIYRWLSLQKDRSEALTLSLESVYARYSKHLAKKHKYKLPSLTRLFLAANAHSTLNLPPFLTTYAANKLSSASLPDPVFLRLLTGQNFLFAHNPGDRRSQLITSKSPGDLRAQKKILKGIRNILTDGMKQGLSQPEVSQQITSFLGTKQSEARWPIELLGHWLAHLLCEKIYSQEIRNKKPEGISTVEQYLGAFSEDLLTVADTTDLSELNGGELNTLFTKVAKLIWDTRTNDKNSIANQTSSRPDWIIGRLKQFLKHIELFHGLAVPTIEIKEDRLAIKQGSMVRSNLISIEEYKSLLHQLGWGRNNLTRQEKMVLVAAILLFRAGLRPSEIFGLLVSDFVGTDEFEVLVQKNHIRDLKTDFSKRRSPLYILVPQEELQFVRNFAAFRKTELGTHRKTPFFTQGPMENEPITRSLLFGPIKPALVELTGDATLVTYSLRHSFACNLLTRLLLRDDFPTKLTPRFLNDSDFYPTACKRLRNDLLENESAGRKALFAGAILMGHADTQTELSSYFHLCDWLLFYYSCRKTSHPHLTAKALQEILGIGRSTAFELLKTSNNPLLDRLPKSTKKHAADLAHPLLSQAQPKPCALAPEATQSNLEPFDEILHSLSQQLLHERLRQPKTWIEVKVLEHFHTQVENSLLTSIQQRTEAANILLKGLKFYDGSLVIEDLDEGRIALQCLKTIGIGPNQMIVRHYPSRWDNRQAKQFRLVWQKKLGIRVSQGDRTCKKNLEYGALGITILEYPALGYTLEYNRKTANLLALWLLALATPNEN